MRWLIWLIWLIPGCSLSGCTAFVARQIEHPEHTRQLGPFDTMLSKIGFQQKRMRVYPGLEMAYWIAPPRDYRFQETFQLRHKGAAAHFSFEFGFRKNPAKAALLPIRGSIVLLHPWGLSGAAMMPWGIRFAASGYEVVMPDLRSQGDSSDAPVGYGPREARDIVRLIRRLRASGKLPAPLYLFGASYGGTVALFAAEQVPHVRGVVALEPYANAAAVIRKAPGSGLFGHRWLVHWITPKEVNAAIRRADRKLDLDLASIDPGNALSKSRRCTLIVRGSKDELMSDASLRQLSDRSPLAAYIEVSDQGHMTLPMRTDLLFQPVMAWMQALPAAPGPCPTLALPASTAAHAASARTAAKAQPH